MGPKQDPRDDGQLEQRDKCDSEQRVVERCDHGEHFQTRATRPSWGRLTKGEIKYGKDE